MGGWLWRDVATRLRSRGHHVYTPTLTGLGERAHLANPNVDLETHITDIGNVLEFEDLTEVTLVGHSYAGAVVQGVADRKPGRLRKLVYLDTGPLTDGMAMLDFFSPKGRAEFDGIVERNGDGWLLPYPGADELGQMASLAGLDDDALGLMAARATAQPYGTYQQVMSLTEVFAGQYERIAIFCSDGGFSIDQVEAMIAAGEPFAMAYADPDWTFHELPTGHWPMLSMPNELSALLDDVAR